MTFLEAVAAAQETGCLFFRAKDRRDVSATQKIPAWSYFALDYGQRLNHFYASAGQYEGALLNSEDLFATDWETAELTEALLDDRPNTWNPRRLPLLWERNER